MYEADLARARELIPLWVRWLEAFTYPCLTFALVLLLADAGAWWLSRSLRADPQAHWTERARQLHRIRRWGIACCCAVALPAVWVTGQHATRLAVLSRGQSVVVCMLSAALASALVTNAEFKRWSRRARIYTWKSWFTMIVVQYAWFLVPVALASSLPNEPDAITLACALALSAFAASLSLRGPFWFLGPLGLARRADLQGFGIDSLPPISSVWSIDLPIANAFAYTVAGKVAISERAREMFATEELIGVLQHEAAHLQESKWLKTARVFVVLLCQAVGYLNPIRATLGRAGTLTLLTATALAYYALLRGNRREEIRADGAAVGPSAHAPAYARALEKIHEFNLLPAVWGRRTTHPDLNDRMVAAGVTPNWPKPARIPRIPLYAFAVLIVVACSVLVVPRIITKRVLARWQRPRENVLALCVTNDERMYLVNLGAEEVVAGRTEPALTFIHAAACVEPLDTWTLTSATMALCDLDRCEEARADLAEAERRALLRPDPDASEPNLQEARKALAECSSRASRVPDGK